MTTGNNIEEIRGEPTRAEAYDKQDEELLLTPDEQRPFVKAGVIGYGDIEVTEEHWDINGLLKAQVAKVKQRYEQKLQRMALNYDIINKLDKKEAKQKRLDRPELREKIAELEHEQWWSWAKSLIPELNDILFKLPEGSLEADRLAERLARWASLFKPYSELAEEQKDQDREWADKSLALIPDIEELKNKWTFEMGKVVRQETNKVVKEAKREERERIPDTIQPYLHWHRGEWCFSPKKYAEMRQALKGE